MREDINNVFRAVQAETQCPFAKTANITFARSIGAEFSVPEAAERLYEDISSYVKEGIVAAPDGLAVPLSNSVIGNDFNSLASGFKSIYHALKMNDGSSEEAVSIEDIEDPGWQLTISEQRLFTIVFSSLYPADNPRHVHEANTTFLFFQPVQSFSSRIPFEKESPEFKRLKEHIRSRFANAGLTYDGAINDDSREAAKCISPQDLGMKAVEWWKSN